MDSLTPLALPLLAWLGPALCVGLAAWQVRKLTQGRAPGREALTERLKGVESAEGREELRQELREERRDAERSIALSGLWPHSMARVSLATGTALAVATLAQKEGALAGHVLSASVQFIGGFAGMAGCSLFGQQAKVRAAELRRGWREAVEMAARE